MASTTGLFLEKAPKFASWLVAARSGGLGGANMAAAFPRSLPPASPSPPKKLRLLYGWPPLRRPASPISSLRIGIEDIAEVAHNKVLVAATLASAIGQLSKPLTSALNGKGIDLKAAIRSGGMPSTHSAGVVAAATSLGLERGFADSIFGMSVVFAAIVMYDAQGVRREVGNHAKFLNRTVKIQEKLTLYQEDNVIDSKSGTSPINSENLAAVLSSSENENSHTSNPESYSICRSRITSSRRAMSSLTVDSEELPDMTYSSYSLLNEAVGHTEIQVLVGALLGFVDQDCISKHGLCVTSTDLLWFLSEMNMVSVGLGAFSPKPPGRKHLPPHCNDFSLF